MLHGGETHDLQISHDFSVNINPLGVHPMVLGALEQGMAEIARYPDQSCGALTKKLSARFDCPPESILCGNGASALLSLAFFAARPERILLPAPSFLGYRKAAESLMTLRAQAKPSVLRYHPLSPENGFALTEAYLAELQKGTDLAVLCTPSNPVGNRIGEGLLREIIDVCEAQGTRLIVDECFLAFLADAEKASVRTLTKRYRCLLVIDAFTKSHALPGLRIGYAFCGDSAFLGNMRALQPEWSVSSPAQLAGCAALDVPPAYLEEARALLRQERAYLIGVLRACGCRVFEGEANYILFSTPEEIFAPLLGQGILIRHCANYEGLSDAYYRIAICTHDKNQVLAEALAALCGNRR